MTTAQKTQIATLRGKGIAYTIIADTLGIGVNTVKSFCRRNHLLGSDISKTNASFGVCEHCGKPLTQTSRKNRRFCCDACRMAWWKEHPGSLNRHAVYHFTCPACDNAFSAYGNAHRKFCSRACYGKAKRICV